MLKYVYVTINVKCTVNCNLKNCDHVWFAIKGELYYTTGHLSLK